MNKANQAAIWGIRAAFYVEYGYEPLITAIEYVGMAIQLDKNNAFWLFFKGLYLGRLRRMKNESITPSEQELVNLELAIRERGDPVFYSFTAEIYLEMVESIEKKVGACDMPDSPMKELSTRLDKFTELAARYFM